MKIIIIIIIMIIIIIIMIIKIIMIIIIKIIIMIIIIIMMIIIIIIILIIEFKLCKSGRKESAVNYLFGYNLFLCGCALEHAVPAAPPAALHARTERPVDDGGVCGRREIHADATRTAPIGNRNLRHHKLKAFRYDLTGLCEDERAAMIEPRPRIFSRPRCTG